jgi:Ca2+-binding RTX toxin-like protein
MAFSDTLNPLGIDRLNLTGLRGVSLYFSPSKVVSNPSILNVAASDIFSSAASYYSIDLTAGTRYSLITYGNTKDNSTLLADSSLQPVVLNNEINDGSSPQLWDFISDFIPATSGKYYLKPSWLSKVGTVTVYEYVPEPKIIIGTDKNDNLVGGDSDDTISGLAANDLLAGGKGSDTLNGGDGIDIAIYSGSRINHELTFINSRWVITLAGEGSDQLIDVERLKFSDTSVALDVSGNAGTALKILAAVFGKSTVNNKQYVGIGLDLLDKGMSYDTLAGLALGIAQATTNDQIVTTLWTNVVGSVPSANDKAPFIKLLQDGLSAGALAHLAADTSLNTNNINLVGLAQTGIEYTPVM